MLINIPDAINEKWNKFASNVLAWNAATSPTFSIQQRIWRGKCVSAYEYSWQSSFEPRKPRTNYLWSSKPMCHLKPAISTQYNKFRNFIWHGIINQSSLWAFSASQIFWGKFEYDPVWLKYACGIDVSYACNWRKFAGKIFCHTSNLMQII